MTAHPLSRGPRTAWREGGEVRCHLMHHAALLPGQRTAIAESIERIRTYLPVGQRRAEIEALARSYGISLRTAYRYARRTREHTCVCHECGRSL